MSILGTEGEKEKMMKFILFIAVIAVVFVSSMAFAVQANREELNSELSALMSEQKEIDKEQLAVNQKAEDSKWVETSLIKVTAEVKAEKSKLESRSTDFNMSQSQWLSDVAPYKQNCEGKVFQRTTEGIAQYNACISDKAYYDKRHDVLRDIHSQLNADIASFNQREKTLQENNELWAKGLTEIKAKQGAVDDRKRAWLVRYNAVINSPAFRQLVKKNGQSGKCASIQGVENIALNVLDGAAEKAHRCLQTVWDGAR